MAGDEVRMMMSVYPGAMTGFAALQSGLVSINNVFMSMTRTMDAQFGLINTAVITTGAVVTQLGIDAMNAFGQFEQSMKIVQMVSGQTKADVEQLGQAANQFSVQYRMDIDQITEGLQTLGRAGLNSASEQAEVLKNGLNTAKLEGRDLNSVLEELIQNTALLGGDLKSSNFGEQSQYVNDLLVATSMTAPITTHDVSETLKYSGGIAAAAGANIETEEGKAILEDYMASIAAFAQKGVTGSIAGTALRAFFNKPATQDKSVTEALASIKLKPEYLWEDDEETMKPVSEQIALIKGQMDKLGVSKMDRLQIWSKIVGGKMGQQMMKLDSEDIKELKKDIQAADDSTSLATRSMQTYQANVKELGEAGALLQRNVGARLVQVVNPFLDVLTKIIEFLNNDALSLPLAAGIIAFIGMVGKKAMAVISSVKAEIATLLNGMQTFYSQKQGWVAPYKPPFDRDRDYGKYNQKTSGGSKGSSSQKMSVYPGAIKDISKMTLSEYNKYFSSKSEALTVSDYKKMGINESNLKMMARMQSLTKDSFGLGISDKQFASVIGKTGVLTKAQQAQMDKLLAGTTGARTPFDSIFGKKKLDPTIASQIAKNEAAIKEFQKLGVELSKLGIITEEDINVYRGLITKAEITSNVLKQQTDAEIGLQEIIELTDTQIKKQVYNEGQLEQRIRLQINEIQSHITALGEDNVATDSATTATNALTTALNSYVPASQKFIQSINGIKVNNGIVNPLGSTPISNLPQADLFKLIYPRASVVGGYTPLPSNIHQMMDTAYIPHKVVEERAREIRANSLRMKDDAMRAQQLKQAYNNPYIPQKTGRTRTDARIEDSLRHNRLKNDFKEYNNAQAAHVQRLFNKHVDNIRSSYKGAGVGGISGRLPTKEAIQASIEANEEAVRQAGLRKVYTSRGSLSAAPSGLGRFGLNWTRDEINAFQDSAKRLSHRARSITKSHPDSISSGMGKFGLGKNDVQKIQENAKEVVRSTMRKVNDAAVNGASSGLKEKGIVSRSAINKIKEDSKKQWLQTREDARKQAQSTRNQSMKYSMPQSNEVIPKNFHENIKIQERLNKLHQIQAQGGAYKLKMEEKAIAAEAEAKQYMRGGWGTNQALSYYNLNQGQLKEIAAAEEKALKTSKGGFGSAFAANFSDRINRNRAGSYLSFGNQMINGQMVSATKGLSGLTNKALNLTDAFGGPLMIAIMGVSFIIQQWQKAFQDYCEDLKKAGDQLKESYTKWNAAEDDLRQTFKDGNPNATDEEINQMIYDSYATMNEDMANAFNNGMDEWFKKINTQAESGKEYEYDEESADGTMKEKQEEEISSEEKYTQAVKENTGALYAATAELNVSLNKYVTKATDSWWGVDGWVSKLTDELGILQDYLSHQFSDGQLGSKYSDANEFLLTASQKDENYAGYTEMAGLMLEDIKDAGDWVGGMKIMMGEDVNNLVQTLPETTKKAMKSMESSILSFGGDAKNMKMQASMKNDSKTWKSLAKELAKRDSGKKAGKNVDKNVQRINGLVAKLNASLAGNFNETQILQAAYLQQMQDMYAITQSAIVPIIQSNMQIAQSTLLQAGGIRGNTTGTGTNTFDTYSTATVIAGLVAQIARATAADTAYNTALAGDPGTASDGSDATDINMDGKSDLTDRAIIELAQRGDVKSGQDFIKEASKLYSGSQKNPFGFYIADTSSEKKGKETTISFYKSDDQRLQEAAPMLFYEMMYEAGAKMTGYNYKAEDALKMGWSESLKGWENGLKSSDVLNTFAKNYTENPNFIKKIVDTYNAAEDEGSSSGSGSGSGSGSDDKNKGTKKERVDLVLCNKKEIPKLNVNLFKKPPTFTVLNKNFKVRDVKINTEDTPKAIMSSIKNAFIDVQKRSDPKIIQDEEAEYDPVAATDGNAVPSGSSRTGTS